MITTLAYIKHTSQLSKTVLYFLVFCLSFSKLWAQVPVPELTGRVVDLTETLSNEQITDLTSKLASLETEKGSQISILIIPTTEDESIEDFSMRVAEKWKIGRKQIDDGVIIVVAKQDRKMRIEVGYGLEDAIPDAKAKQIISEQMAPAFREGDFVAGLNAAVDSLTLLIQGEELPEPQNQADFDDEQSSNGFIIFATAATAFILHLMIPTAIAVLIATFVFWIISIIVYKFSFVSLFSCFIMAMIGVSFYRFGGSGSGSGGYSSGGSSSGGGFSGGGGSFGGGGSSGSW